MRVHAANCRNNFGITVIQFIPPLKSFAGRSFDNIVSEKISIRDFENICFVVIVRPIRKPVPDFNAIDFYGFIEPLDRLCFVFSKVRLIRVRGKSKCAKVSYFLNINFRILRRLDNFTNAKSQIMIVIRR